MKLYFPFVSGHLFLLIVSFFSVKGEINGKKFDFLVFAQIWPVTSCDIWEAKNSENACSLPNNKDGWTIHGIWPSATNGKHPFFCNKSLPFDENALAEIMPQLKERWADVHKNSPEGSFWKHEWLKHGTCAVQLDPMNTELKYFNQGLIFNKAYNVSAILSENGILPGGSYTGNKIMDSIKASVGKWPAISCVQNDQYVSTEDNLLLSEVSICMDRNFTVIDCYNQKTYGGCSPDKPINTYPVTPHSQSSGNIGGTIFGVIVVILLLIGAATCLFLCYRRNITRYRGYENI